MIQLFLATWRLDLCALGLVSLLVVSCGDDGPKSPRRDGGASVGSGAPGRGVPVAGGDASTVPGQPTDAGNTSLVDAGNGSSVDGAVPGSATDAGTTPAAGDASISDEVFYAKLRTCGLLSAGRTSPAAASSSPVDDCVRPCLLSATCQELSLYLCSDSLTGGFATCATACIPKCVGGTTTGDTPDFCDGVAQCKDGSDEVGCDRFYFACTNGMKTTRDYTCDGEDDCGDGSDELGCAASFACAPGEEPVPARYVCDQEADCGNGSDETGCAAYICS
jgi:hypothetical protein